MCLFAICVVAASTKYDRNGAKKKTFLRNVQRASKYARENQGFFHVTETHSPSYGFRSRDSLGATTLKTVLRLIKEILNYKRTVQAQKLVSHLMRRTLRHLDYARNNPLQSFFRSR